MFPRGRVALALKAFRCLQSGKVTKTTAQILMMKDITGEVVSSLTCLWLFCDPMDSNPPGASLHGISHARVLERIAISFSMGFSRPRDWNVSCIGRPILYHGATREAPQLEYRGCKLQRSLRPAMGMPVGTHLTRKDSWAQLQPSVTRYSDTSSEFWNLSIYLKISNFLIFSV